MSFDKRCDIIILIKLFAGKGRVERAGCRSSKSVSEVHEVAHGFRVKDDRDVGSSSSFAPSKQAAARGNQSVFERRSRVIVSGTANLHYFLRPVSLFVHF